MDEWPFPGTGGYPQLLMSQDLSPSGTPGTFTVWDCRSGGPVGYHPDTGYAQDGVEPALLGTFAITLADGKAIACRPALELAQGAGRPTFPGTVGGDHLGARGLRPQRGPAVRDREAVFLLHLGGARTAHQRHADQPGRVLLLRPHGAVR